MTTSVLEQNNINRRGTLPRAQTEANKLEKGSILDLAEKLENASLEVKENQLESSKAKYVKQLYDRLLKENEFRAMLNNNMEYQFGENNGYWKENKTELANLYKEKRELALEDKWQQAVKKKFNESRWGAGIQIGKFKLGLQHVPFVGSFYRTIGMSLMEKSMMKECAGKKEELAFDSKKSMVEFNQDIYEQVKKRGVSGVALLDDYRKGFVPKEALGFTAKKYKWEVMRSTYKYLEARGMTDKTKMVRIAKMVAFVGVNDLLGLSDASTGEKYHTITRAWDSAKAWTNKMSERFFGEGQATMQSILGLSGLVAWRYAARNNDIVRGLLGATAAYKLSNTVLSSVLKEEAVEKFGLTKAKLQSALERFERSEDIWKGLSEKEIAQRVEVEKKILRANKWKKGIKFALSAFVAVGAGYFLYSSGLDHEVANHVEASSFMAHAHASTDNHFAGFGGHLNHGLGHDVASDHVDSVSNVSVAHDVVQETNNHVSNMDAFSDQVLNHGEVDMDGVYHYARAHNIDMRGYKVEQEIMSNLDKYSDPHELKELLEHTDKFRMPMGMGDPDGNALGVHMGNVDHLDVGSDGQPTIEVGFGEEHVDQTSQAYIDNHINNTGANSLDVGETPVKDGQPTVESGFGEEEGSSVLNVGDDHMPTTEYDVVEPVTVAHVDEQVVSHPVKYASYEDIESEYGKFHHSADGQANFLNYMNETKPTVDSAQFLPQEASNLPDLSHGQIITDIDSDSDLPDLSHGQILTDNNVDYDTNLTTDHFDTLPPLDQGQILTNEHGIDDANLPDLTQGRIVTDEVITTPIESEYNHLPSLEQGQIEVNVDTSGLPDLSQGRILVDDSTPVMPDLTNGQIVENQSYNLENILVNKPVDDTNELPDLTQGRILVE
ncbi:MAG: hypothetical protein WC570_03175 [Patescibacteria group bacterium]